VESRGARVGGKAANVDRALIVVPAYAG
jgi:hypothetical protein